MNQTSLMKLLKAELVKLASERGLDTGGTKLDITRRILNSETPNEQVIVAPKAAELPDIIVDKIPSLVSIKKMLKSQLVELCKKFGLKETGLKAELIERLENYRANQIKAPTLGDFEPNKTDTMITVPSLKPQPFTMTKMPIEEMKNYIPEIKILDFSDKDAKIAAFIENNYLVAQLVSKNE